MASTLGNACSTSGRTALFTRRCHAALAPLSSSTVQGARTTTIARAGDGRDPNTDWDAAWRSFQQQVRTQVDTQPQTSTPKFRRPSPATSSVDKLKQQERVLLDLWTQEDVLKLGGVAAGVLLLAMILAAGPMPMDDRCTLPWC